MQISNLISFPTTEFLMQKAESVHIRKLKYILVQSTDKVHKDTSE
jgi:hypothetical protein